MGPIDLIIWAGAASVGIVIVGIGAAIAVGMILGVVRGGRK